MGTAPRSLWNGVPVPVFPCVNNVIPADGLLNVPNFCADCVCNLPIQTSFAMVYMPEAADWGGAKAIPMPVPPVAAPEGTPRKP